MKIILKAGPFELVEDISIPDKATIHSVTIDLTDPVLAIEDGQFTVEDLRINQWGVEYMEDENEQ